MRWGLILQAAACLASYSCSLLFTPSDDSLKDAATELDAEFLPEMCSTTATLPVDRGPLGLNHGDAVDIDGDGEDELLLFGSSLAGVQVYVSFAACQSEGAWQFQQLWQPQRAGAGAPLIIDDVAGYESRLGETRVVAIGEADDEGLLLSFLLEDRVLPAEPDYEQMLPQAALSVTCEDADAPYQVITGNFDDDSELTHNDIVLATNKQTFLYGVTLWNALPAWNRECLDGLASGTVPVKISGSGTRLSLLYLPRTPAFADSFVDLRESRVDWRFDETGTTASDWPFGDAQGVAHGRTASADDVLVDAVGWGSASPLNLTKVTLLRGPSARSIEFSDFTLDLDGAQPTDAVILEHESGHYLLLLVGTSLKLLTLDETPMEVSSIDLEFLPLSIVTPNWGPEGAVQVHVFDPDTGRNACFELNAEATLELC